MDLGAGQGLGCYHKSLCWISKFPELPPASSIFALPGLQRRQRGLREPGETVECSQGGGAGDTNVGSSQPPGQLQLTAQTDRDAAQ